MQCVQNWCPSCLSNCIRVGCVYFAKKMGRKKKSYEGLNELQEEEFRFREKDKRAKIFSTGGTSHESSAFQDKIQPAENISMSDMIGDDKKIKVEMEVKLLLNDGQESNPTKRTSKSKKQGQSINILEEEKTNEIDLLEEIQHQEHAGFKVNIDPFNKYYAILHEKVSEQKVAELLSIKGEPLQLSAGENRSNFVAEHCKSPNKDGQVFIISYNLPCSYSFYSNLMSQGSSNNNSQQNPSIFKGFSPVIDQCVLLQSLQTNLKVCYSSFGKYMILEPREFTYLKYSYGLDDQHWEICMSVDLAEAEQYKKQMNQNHQANNDKEKGKKIEGQCFVVTYLKQHSEKERTQLEVKSYCWVDIKSSIKTPKFLNRGLSDVKGYVEEVYRYCEISFQEELA